MEHKFKSIQGIDLKREIYTNKTIGSICHGQQIMFSCDILNGMRSTCYPGIKDDLVNAGGVYIDERVVSYRKIVTSRRPQDLPYFMKTFINMLR